MEGVASTLWFREKMTSTLVAVPDPADASEFGTSPWQTGAQPRIQTEGGRKRKGGIQGRVSLPRVPFYHTETDSIFVETDSAFP